MAEDKYNVDDITDEMEGTIAFWAERLDMGRANIRTARKNGALEGELKPYNPEKPNLKAWHFTGAQIKAWRENIATRSAGSGKAAGPKARKYKIATSLTPEQAEELKQYLAKFSGDFEAELVLVSQRKAKPSTEAPADEPAEVSAEAPKGRRLFG